MAPPGGSLTTEFLQPFAVVRSRWMATTWDLLNRSARKFRVSGGVLCLVVALIVILMVGRRIIFLTSPLQNAAIVHGVTCAGVDFSGLTKGQARRLLAASLPSLDHRAVEMHANSLQETRSAASLGAFWDVDASVEAAYTVGRTSTGLDRLWALETTADQKYNVKVDLRVEPRLLEAGSWHFRKMVEIPPHNASVVFADVGSSSLEPVDRAPARSGVGLDVPAAAKAVEDALNSTTEKKAAAVVLPMKIVEPEISDDVLSSIDFGSPVSEFKTNYNAALRGRTHNLALACHAITGTVILPGHVFSYNRRLGPRTIGKGYQSAPIFVEGEVKEDTGGGICQVATTLYNAALLAGCKIVERNHHSMKTSYIGPGRDATVAWDGLDFKFRNNLGNAILLTAAVGDGDVTVRIWGCPVPGRSVTVYTRPAQDGVVTYRDTSLMGERVRHELVSRDPYPRRPEE